MESGGTDNTISIDVGLVLSFAGINDRKSVEAKEFERNSSQIQAKRRLMVLLAQRLKNTFYNRDTRLVFR